MLLPKRPMTPQAIINRVNEEAQARLSDIIGRAFIGLRNRHTHTSFRKECNCDYCRFITGSYTTAKLQLHRLNKELRRIEGWDYYYSQPSSWNICQSHRNWMDKVKELKKEKLELKNHIV